MKKSRFSHLIEGKTGEVMLWISVFILLTVNNARFNLQASLLLAFFSLIGMIGISFLNRYLLIPKLFNMQKNYMYLSVSIIAVFIFIIAFSLIDMEIIREYLPPFPRMRRHHHPPMGIDFMPFLKSGFLIIGSFLVTTLFYMISKAKLDETRTRQLQSEKSLMELKFLKSQINPHFLFNALNNIYAMIYTGDKNAANSVLKLSEMLRYVTDECQAETIPVEKEIHYIENFIDFQQMRAEKQMNVQFTKVVKSNQISIPPMLFQPFVENCFKHSRIDNDPNARIFISLSENESGLLFTAENTISRQKVIKSKPTRDGIGISNVKKRLDLIYPEKHKIDINETADNFIVKLYLSFVSKEQEQEA